MVETILHVILWLAVGSTIVVFVCLVVGSYYADRDERLASYKRMREAIKQELERDKP